mmetsp:Transcript_22592/g.55712  ORF Transcript_22592/g.55712 Transcript_22592/m.55712 type:complete len:327 (-) Transcript_22592:618-1598(-)
MGPLASSTRMTQGTSATTRTTAGGTRTRSSQTSASGTVSSSPRLSSRSCPGARASRQCRASTRSTARAACASSAASSASPPLSTRRSVRGRRTPRGTGRPRSSTGPLRRRCRMLLWGMRSSSMICCWSCGTRGRTSRSHSGGWRGSTATPMPSAATASSRGCSQRSRGPPTWRGRAPRACRPSSCRCSPRSPRCRPGCSPASGSAWTRCSRRRGARSGAPSTWPWGRGRRGGATWSCGGRGCSDTGSGSGRRSSTTPRPRGARSSGGRRLGSGCCTRGLCAWRAATRTRSCATTWRRAPSRGRSRATTPRSGGSWSSCATPSARTR